MNTTTEHPTKTRGAAVSTKGAATQTTDTVVAWMTTDRSATVTLRKTVNSPVAFSDVDNKLAEIDTDFPTVWKIDTHDQYQAAGNILKTIKERQKTLKDARMELTRPIDNVKKIIMDRFSVPEKRLVDAEAALKRGILDYDRQQEAERRRIEADLREKQRKEEEEAERKAKLLEKRGRTEEAEAVRDAVTPVPSVQLDKPTLRGIFTRGDWKAEVTSIEKLIVAVADGDAPVSLLKVDTVALNQMARAMKDKAKIPGVKFYQEETMTVRTS